MSGWLERATTPTNLTPLLDGLWGRDADLVRAFTALQTARLVTLTGTGGVGKTRLAHAVGLALVEQIPGGVWWVDLAEARTIDDIHRSLAEVLGIQLGVEPAQALTTVLAHRPEALYVLDNLEQLRDLLGETLSRWLAGAPEARFLVTSREVLQLRGEVCLPVPPLATEDAVALFAARVTSRRPDFALDEARTDDVTRLVEALDGLPLALELAAGRAAFLGVRALRERLGDRFRLLADRSPDRPARQRRIEDTIAWSWELLQPFEQAALAQSSVFRGTFDPAVLAEVIDLSPWPEAPWALDVVQALAEKSLFRQLGGQLRHFETIRCFAEQRLQEFGDAGARVRHAIAYARQFNRSDAPIPSSGQVTNLVVAGEGEGEAAALCVLCIAEAQLLSTSWDWLGGHLERHARTAEGALRLRLELMSCEVDLACHRVPRALARLEDCRARLEVVQDDLLAVRLSLCESFLARLRRDRGAAAATAHAALERAQQAGCPRTEVSALRALGRAYLSFDLEIARGHLEAAVAVESRAGLRRTLTTHLLLAEVHRQVGRTGRALETLDALLAVEEGQSHRYRIIALAHKAHALRSLHRLPDSAACVDALEDVARRAGRPHGQLFARELRAYAGMLEGRWEEIVTTLEALVREGLPRHRVAPALAIALHRVGREDAAEDEIRGLTEAASSLGPHAQSLAHYARFRTATQTGRLHAARQHARAAVDTMVSDQRFVWQAAEHLAQVDCWMGEAEGVAAKLEPLIERLRTLQIPVWQARLQTALAAALVAQGLPEEALQHLDEALGLSIAVGDQKNRLAIARTRGEAYRRLQRWETAHACIAQALATCGGTVAIRGGLLLTDGRVWLEQGDRARALRCFEAALPDLERTGTAWEVVDALCWLARAEQPAGAARYLRRAERLVDTIGETSATAILERLHALQARLRPRSARVLVLVADQAQNAEIASLLEAAGHRVDRAHACDELEGLTEPVDAVVVGMPADRSLLASLHWLRQGLGARVALWLGAKAVPPGLVHVDSASNIAHHLSEALLSAPAAVAPGQLILGGTRVNLISRTVTSGGTDAPLREMEARLLAYLAAAEERVVPREELLEAVWGYAPGVGSRTLDTTVGRLRKKIEPVPSEPAHLFTVRRRGYCLRDVGRPPSA